MTSILYESFESFITKVLQYEDRIARLTRENAYLSRNVRKSMREKKQLLQQICIIKAEHEEERIKLTQSFSEELKDIQSMHEQTVTQNSLVMEFLQESLTHAHNTADNDKQKVQVANEEISSLNELLIEMKQRFSETENRATSRDAVAEYLHTQNEQLRTKLSATEQSLHHAQSTNEQFHDELVTCQEQLQCNQDLLTVAHNELNQLQDSLNNRSAELCNSEELQTQYKQDLQESMSKCELLTEKCVQQGCELNHLEYRVEELKAEGQLKDRQQRNLQNTITQLNSEMLLIKEVTYAEIMQLRGRLAAPCSPRRTPRRGLDQINLSFSEQDFSKRIVT